MFSSNTSQVSGDTKYIEDYFSTFLYSGTGASQTITNGIDLATKGGLVWLKARNDTRNNWLYDTVRGKEYGLRSDLTFAENYSTNSITAFNNNGFSIGDSGNINTSGNNLVSWSIAKSPKFFDVVTYTGNGTTQNIAHNLGSVPGCIIVKEASAAGNDWQVYHRSTTNTCGRLFLNLTNAENANGRANTWGDNTNPVPPTSTVFTVGNTGSVNNNGATFVAYLFAHDAGGFGLTGTDNVISCGSYTGNGSATGPEINLGYEPQWLLIKNTTTSGYDWWMFDVMRGWTNTSSGDNTSRLTPDSSQAEDLDRVAIPTATGFRLVSSTTNYNGSGNTYIYIAIRRGPMKVPTSGTSVFSPEAFTGDATTRTIGGILTDSLLLRERSSDSWDWSSRLTGSDNYLQTNNTTAESSAAAGTRPSYTKAQLGVVYNGSTKNQSGANYIDYLFRRAPSFFDEVCYTGDGVSTGRAINHNLGVVPELMIIKWRNGSQGWYAYSAPVGNERTLFLNLTDAVSATSTGYWYNTTPTSTVFTLGSGPNQSSRLYVAYLFATCAGVSKVGSYTGTGTTKQVDCGFTGGARFVLIKKTSGTGSWYIWDSARGIVSGNDPYLLLNSTAAEVTNTDYIDTYSAGFEISSTAPSEINENGGSFIFLAIS